MYDKIPGMKRVIVIGQAPPLRPASEPFGRTRLYGWLGRIGVTRQMVRQTFLFTALVDVFPGRTGNSDKPPSRDQIVAALPRLRAFLRTSNPDIIVPVGSLAIRYALGRESISLKNAVGKAFTKDPFGALGREVVIIPLPHPSGASPWVHLDQNEKLFQRALARLQKELAVPN